MNKQFLNRANTVILALILLASLFTVPLVYGANEDLTTYTEADSSNRFAVTADTITITNQYRDDDLDWVYKDGGAGAYGDFSIDFDIKAMAMDMTATATWRGVVMMFGDTADADWGWYGDNIENVWAVAIDCKDAGATWALRILNFHGGVNNHGDHFSTLSIGTQYYCTLSKTGATAVLTIYSDAGRTTQVATDTHTLSADYSFRYFYAIASASMVGSYAWSGVLENLEFPPAPCSFYTQELATYYELGLNSNTTGDNKFTFGYDSGLSTGDEGVIWKNDTGDTKAWASSTYFRPNQANYWKVQIYDHTTHALIYDLPTQTFTHTIDETIAIKGWQVINNTVIATDFECDGNLYYDEEYGKLILAVSDTTVAEDYVYLYESSDGAEWSLNSSYARSAVKQPVLVKKGGTHIMYVHDANAASYSVAYTGTAWDSLTYYGVVTDPTEVPRVAKCFRVNAAWYNTTDELLYAYIGGGDDTKGDWEITYIAKSSDVSFIGDVDATSLQEEEDFPAGWSDSFNYPPRVIWEGYEQGDKSFGWQQGCGSAVPPYQFDQDLIWITNPGDDLTASADYYSAFSDADAYGEAVMGISSPMYASIASLSGQLYASFAREDVTDIGMMYLTGIVFDKNCTVKKGAYPRLEYNGFLPTKTQFNNFADANFYTDLGDLTVNVNHLDGSSPIYGEMTFSSYTVDDVVLVSLTDLTTDTIYLHVSTSGDKYILELNDEPIGADQTLTPSGTGNDFLFEFGLPLINTAPVNDDLTVSGLEDIDNIYPGMHLTLTYSGHDVDGAADLTQLDLNITQEATVRACVRINLVTDTGSLVTGDSEWELLETSITKLGDNLDVTAILIAEKTVTSENDLDLKAILTDGTDTDTDVYNDQFDVLRTRSGISGTAVAVGAGSATVGVIYLYYRRRHR